MHVSRQIERTIIAKLYKKYKTAGYVHSWPFTLCMYPFLSLSPPKKTLLRHPPLGLQMPPLQLSRRGGERGNEERASRREGKGEKEGRERERARF